VNGGAGAGHRQQQEEEEEVEQQKEGSGTLPSCGRNKSLMLDCKRKRTAGEDRDLIVPCDTCNPILRSSVEETQRMLAKGRVSSVLLEEETRRRKRRRSGGGSSSSKRRRRRKRTLTSLLFNVNYSKGRHPPHPGGVGR